MPHDETEPETELPSEADLDFYYGLNRHRAQKSDAQFSRIGIGAIAGVFLLPVLLVAVACFFARWGFGLLLILFLLLLTPVGWSLLVLFGGGLGAALSLFLDSIHATLTRRDR